MSQQHAIHKRIVFDIKVHRIADSISSSSNYYAKKKEKSGIPIISEESMMLFHKIKMGLSSYGLKIIQTCRN